MSLIKLKEGCDNCGCKYFAKHATHNKMTWMNPTSGYIKHRKIHRFRCVKCMYIKMKDITIESIFGHITIVKNEKLC